MTATRRYTDLLVELIAERKAELQALVDRVAARGLRPSGLYTWTRGEAKRYRLTGNTITRLEARLKEEQRP